MSIMKSLQSIFEAIGNRIISTNKIKVTWTDNFKGLYDWAQDHIEDYTPDLRKLLEAKLQQFYTNNPKKRNVSYSMCTLLEMRIPNDSSPLVEKLYKLYDDIGMNYWWFCKRNKERLGYLECSAALTSKNQLDDIKFNETVRLESLPQKFEEDGNGYNHLTGKTITTYREKLLECITDTVVEVSEIDRVIAYTKYPCQGGLKVVITPIFSNSKLNKLYKEIASDETLAKYADIMKSTSDGIAAYYASKGPGDYTGD